MENKEERFALDNVNNILDFEDPIARYCTPQEDVVKLLNDYDRENKQLRKDNKKLTNKITKLNKQHIKSDKELPRYVIGILEQLLNKQQTLDVMVQSGHYINQQKVNVIFAGEIKAKIQDLKRLSE